ncbi:Inositol-1-monophosphatase [Pseudovibrio axinellae]|uniref:Inositol-1-monophosphatase n=1 Tax=Pseudovibrio axinellae TaxID=989403 RepID=A0A165YDB4_9HYPH|nr:3'(2'),5'-bisphosphate nucleotidase CysQ [Pseudovibrio axinellae]KZL18740.1 Inositol-1-monophosphatase [Pseudovibrio axinellae]SEP94550.1 myo-inositol-1(or 4)-monophosphatase [Pseudovibrio axinellae]
MPEADTHTLQDDLELLVSAALKGGEIALSYFGNSPKNWTKEGDSPVSVADIEVDLFLSSTLREARPQYGWLSEETTDDLVRKEYETVFIVDPIDGTRAFLNGRDEWCLSLAVVTNGRPTVGVIYCPIREELYTAVCGAGSHLNRQKISVSDKQSVPGSYIAGPVSFLEKEGVKREQIRFSPYLGSLAYRFALVACGKLDAGLARARARDWDLAAADLIISEAGGQLVDLSGSTLCYNKTKTNHPGLVASSAKLFKRLQGISVED